MKNNFTARAKVSHNFSLPLSHNTRLRCEDASPPSANLGHSIHPTANHHCEDDPIGKEDTAETFVNEKNRPYSKIKKRGSKYLKKMLFPISSLARSKSTKALCGVINCHGDSNTEDDHGVVLDASSVDGVGWEPNR